MNSSYCYLQRALAPTYSSPNSFSSAFQHVCLLQAYSNYIVALNVIQFTLQYSSFCFCLRQLFIFMRFESLSFSFDFVVSHLGWPAFLRNRSCLGFDWRCCFGINLICGERRLLEALNRLCGLACFQNCLWIACFDQLLEIGLVFY